MVLTAASPSGWTAPADQAAQEAAAGVPAKSAPKQQVAALDPSYRYAINLASSQIPFTNPLLPQTELLNTHRIYMSRFVKDGRVWNRLRVGFFPNKSQAKVAVEPFLQLYPDAWITRVTDEERIESARLVLASLRTESAETPGAKPRATVAPPIPAVKATPPAEQKPAEKVPADVKLAATPPATVAPTPTSPPPAAVAPTPTPTPTAPSTSPPATTGTGFSEQRVAALADEARVAMTGKNYRRAVQIYTKLLEGPESKYRQEAQELLGLARERGGQLAHAKAEYETYLKRYPEGEGADRVRQRLAGIITSTVDPQEKLRKAKGPESEEFKFDYYGSFSQFYYRDVSITDVEGDIVNQSSSNTDLDVTARFSNPSKDIRARFTGGHVQDFRGAGNPAKTRINALYLDAEDMKRGVSGRIGRQSRSSGGILGRFDGGVLSYEVLPQLELHAAAGFPVDSVSSMSIDPDRYFYGLSADIGPIQTNYDFNVFAINQSIDGITDRQAIGGEIRYSGRRMSLFGLVDYDVSYNELNTVLLTGNYIFPDRTTVNASFNYQNSPILTTRNALQGQTTTSISDLMAIYTEDQVRQFAVDRTATNTSFTAGVSRPLTDKLQASGDLTVTKLSDTVASGGVAASPGTDVELFYSAQLIGSNLIRQGDIAIVGVRYADATTSDTVTLSLNTRYPFTRDLRINPRVRADYRTTDTQGKEYKIRPSARINYRWDRNISFEGEGGGEWSSNRTTSTTEDTKGYFFNLGVRVDF